MRAPEREARNREIARMAACGLSPIDISKHLGEAGTPLGERQVQLVLQHHRRAEEVRAVATVERGDQMNARRDIDPSESFQLLRREAPRLLALAVQAEFRDGLTIDRVAARRWLGEDLDELSTFQASQTASVPPVETPEWSWDGSRIAERDLRIACLHNAGRTAREIATETKLSSRHVERLALAARQRTHAAAARLTSRNSPPNCTGHEPLARLYRRCEDAAYLARVGEDPATALTSNVLARLLIERSARRALAELHASVGAG